MDISEANSFIPLIAAGCYTVLLIIPLTRRSQQEKQTRWLLAFLVLSIVWEFLLFFAPGISHPPNLPVEALLVGTTLLGVITALFVDWPRQQRWLLLGGSAIGATLLLDYFLPTQALALPGNILPITYSSLISYLTWFALSGYILAITWRNYRSTRFPWHANRLLFWVVVLLVTFIGEALLFFNRIELAIAGQIIRFIGIMGLAYAVSFHRIFDVRTRLQRLLAFIIITLISALPLAAAILLVQRFTTDIQDDSTSVFLIVGIITLSFFFYQPFRRFVERFAYRYLPGKVVNTGQVVRDYSQAISRTLDVQQLSLFIIGMLNELIETNRGALMLVTKVDDGFEIEPIPAMGRVSRKKIRFPFNSLFINALTQQHQPLLQYEIDFNPDFAHIGPDKRDWLKEMAMEVYVPVSTGKEIDGLIAIGPKSSAVPYQPGELELVQTLADQTVVALQNARLYSELGSQNEKIRHLNVNLVSQNERLEIMDRVKSDFITIASHELRTPLTQVKGYVDILAAMNDENALTRKETREIISHVNRATLRLESLISAMLDASQLDVDGMQLTFVKTRLDMILRLAMEPLIHAMRERRISMRMEGVEELPSIQADFKRLVQAFTNLIGNAVKYTPDHGRITIQASVATSRDGEEEFIDMVITDTGIGIDPRFHELIFEKFFRIGDPQLHSTGSTKFKGAGPGLGLPIAKGVIEAHGGRIWVESEGEDEERLPGSSFHIILPAHPPGAEIESDKEARPAYLIG